MELSPRTYRFLHVNGISLLVFFFMFGFMVGVQYASDGFADDLKLLVALLLLVCGLIVTSLHWTLIQGLKTGAIVIRERHLLARP